MVCQKTFKIKLLIFCLVFAFCFSPMVVHAEGFSITSEGVTIDPSYTYLLKNSNVTYPTDQSVSNNQPSFSGHAFQTVKVASTKGNYVGGYIYIQTIFELPVYDNYSHYEDISIDISCDAEGVSIADYRFYVVSQGKYRCSYYLFYDDVPSLGNNLYTTVDFDILFTPTHNTGTTYYSDFDVTVTSEVVNMSLYSADDITGGNSKEAGLAKWLKGIKENTYGIWMDLNAGIQSVVGKLQELINSMNTLLFGTGTGSSTSLSEGGGLIGESNSLQEQQNQLQGEGNALQEEANTLQEEANETQKNIFDKIADFFDNFFSRLGDFLLGLIVPSAEELTTFLDEVNAWFSDRLGFIWYPFSFAIDMVSALAGGSADTGFKVPGFSLNILGTEYQIWSGMTVDMDAFGIFRYVRIFTSFLLVGGIVKLAYDKWDEWIGGHGVG